MADRYRERVRSIVGPGYLAEPEKQTNHFLHLRLIGLTVPCGALLDFQRGVLRGAQAALGERQQDDAASLAYGDGGTRIRGKEQLFDGGLVGGKLGNDAL